jgi:hypothetical protein
MTGVTHTFGPRGLGSSVIGASIGQASGTPYKWSSGVEGFAKRYVSGFAGTLVRQSFAFGQFVNLWQPTSKNSSRSIYPVPYASAIKQDGEGPSNPPALACQYDASFP